MVNLPDEFSSFNITAGMDKNEMELVHFNNNLCLIAMNTFDIVDMFRDMQIDYEGVQLKLD